MESDVMDKPFSEIAVGSNFKYNGVDYRKIDKIRVSCCQSVNAVAIANSANRIFIPDNTTVVVNA
jgi:hypothetical protein